jgi:GT2 family glycosyltransferase
MSARLDLPPEIAPEVSVVIVAYDSAEFLPACLASIPGGAGSLPHEVIVVDNASADGTLEWLARSAPDVQVLENGVNRGFATASNQGIRAARGAYILLLNPDTRVGAEALAHTVGYLREHPRTAAASCKVLRPDGRLDPSCKREFPSLWDAFARFSGLSRVFPHSRLFARYDARYLDDAAAQEVPLIDGCFMMMRRDALNDIGLLDERFFMYAEEMDWCRRAHEGGWAIGYEPAGTTVHHKGAITRRHTFRMLFHFHRSMAVYYWKHGHHRALGMCIVLPGLVLRCATLVVLNACRRDRHVSG